MKILLSFAGALGLTFLMGYLMPEPLGWILGVPLAFFLFFYAAKSV
jgi:hypothetical protein